MIFKEVDDGYLDEKNCLIWHNAQCKDSFTFYDAIEYCKSLGNGWRMPTINELVSIVDYEKCNPASYLPDMMSSNYWSATLLANYTDFAWLVYFKYGNINDSNKSNTYYVRAVKDYNV